MAIEHLPYTSEQVEDNFSFNNVLDKSLSTARKQKRMSRDIKILRDQEEKLYMKLGVKNLEEFASRVQKLVEDNPGLNNFVNGGPDFNKIIYSIAPQELIDVEERIYDFLNQPKVKKEFGESQIDKDKDITLQAIDFLNQQLRNIDEKYHISTSKTAVKGEERGFISRFVIIKQTDGKIVFKTKEGKELDSYWKKRFLQIINGTNSNTQQQMKPQDIADFIYDNYVKNRNDITPNIKRRLKYEMTKNLDKYALSTSANQIRGFLGELRETVILKELFKGQKVKVSPTGVEKIITAFSKGKDAPIDITIDGINFQVKNYGQLKQSAKKLVENILPNSAQFTHKMKMGNFIEQRLAQSSMKDDVVLRKKLVKIYGSLQYNRPFSEGNPKSIEEYKENVYSKFDEYTQFENGSKMHKLLDSSVNSILGIEKEFQGENLFQQERIYYNTFFIIRGKYIPASVILDVILETVTKQIVDNEFYTSSYQMEIDKKFGLEDIYKKVVKNKTVPYTFLEAANHINFQYEYVFNIDKLVERALGKI